MKKHSAAVQKFLDELAKIGTFTSYLPTSTSTLINIISYIYIADHVGLMLVLIGPEFPGSKAVSEAATKVGPAYVSGPVLFVFEKVSTFVVTTEEEEAAPPAPEAEPETSCAEVKEKEIAVEAAAPTPAEEKAEEPPKAEDAPPAAAAAEPPKP